LLDEYAEDFGTNIASNFSEEQKRQIKGSPLPYQNDYNPYSQQPISPPPPPPPPNVNPYQNYPGYPPNYAQQQYTPPVPPVQPARSRLDNIFPEESKELNELLRAEDRAGCLKNILFSLLAIGIIAASFWGSFLIGKKFFMPADYSGRKNELPSFLLKQTKNKLKDTLDNAKKITQQTDDLFKVVDKPQELPGNILPPEVRNKPVVIGNEVQLSEPKPFPGEEKTYVPPVKTTTYKPPVKSTVAAGTAIYRVIAGTYDTKQIAEDAAVNLRNDGFPNFIYFGDGKYRVQIGAFKSKERATQYMQKAREYGYNSVLSVR